MLQWVLSQYYVRPDKKTGCQIQKGIASLEMPQKLLSGVAMVETKHSTEPLATVDFTIGVGRFDVFYEQPVPHTLMVSFFVIVQSEFMNGSAQRGFAEENHAIDAF